MNTQPSTRSQIANMGRSRATTILFAGLVVAAAVIIVGILALSQRTPETPIAARGPTNHGLIASCRPCRDEALAARQDVRLAGGLAAPSIVVGTSPRALIMNCRICRDEALGANQISLRTADRSTTFWRLEDPRQSGRR